MEPCHDQTVENYKPCGLTFATLGGFFTHNKMAAHLVTSLRRWNKHEYAMLSVEIYFYRQIFFSVICTIRSSHCSKTNWCTYSLSALIELKHLTTSLLHFFYKSQNSKAMNQYAQHCNLKHLIVSVKLCLKKTSNFHLFNWFFSYITLQTLNKQPQQIVRYLT